MRCLLYAFTLFSFTQSLAQFDPNYRKNNPGRSDDAETSPLNVGLGLGINYGGVGARVEFVPQKNVALFGAIGYNLHKTGFNIGAKVKFATDKRVSPMVQAMYGYNAVIVVIDASEYNKTYYGPSIGGGIELNVGRQNNFMEFGLLIPFRSPDFSDDIADLQAIGIDITEPLPFAITVGYHFRL